MEGVLSQVVGGEGRTVCLPWCQATVYGVAKSRTRLSTHEEMGQVTHRWGKKVPEARPWRHHSVFRNQIWCYKSLWHLSVIAYGCPRGRCDLKWSRCNQCLQLSHQLIESPKKAMGWRSSPGVPSFLGWRSSPRGSQRLRKTLFLPEAECEQSIVASSSFRKWFQRNRTLILWSRHC